MAHGSRPGDRIASGPPGWASLGAAGTTAARHSAWNARGYTAYVLFALLATGLFVKSLREDRLALWALYVTSMVLAFASFLMTTFVLGAHGLVALAALLTKRVRRESASPAARRLLFVFGLLGLFVLVLYAAAIPQMEVYARSVYRDPAAGFSLLSREFVGEVMRGLVAGGGPAILAAGLAGAGLAAPGFAVLIAWDWALALALPVVLQTAAFVTSGLVVSPRFFLLALPVAALALAQGTQTIATALAAGVRRPGVPLPLGLALILLIGLTSAAQLRGHYALPKQDYRGTIEYIEAAGRPDGIVIVMHLAEAGFRYYSRRLGTDDGRRYVYVRSTEALNAALAGHDGAPRFLVTTFPRALRISHPDLSARLSREGPCRPSPEPWVTAISSCGGLVHTRRPDRSPTARRPWQAAPCEIRRPPLGISRFGTSARTRPLGLEALNRDHQWPGPVVSRLGEPGVPGPGPRTCSGAGASP